MIGTLRMSTIGSRPSAGTPGLPRVFTAFGEKITGPQDRNAYAGAWGYQAHTEFAFQHVGHRYYDPGSGRFLQRDPIGMQGGFNVYLYVGANPLLFVDPSGLDFLGSVGGAFLAITGGSGTTFLDRLGNRLAGRNTPAGPASGVGSAVNSRRRKGTRLPGQRRGTNRLASRLTRRGLGRAANAVRRFAPLCAAIGGIVDTAIIVREIPFAYYGVPPGQY